MILISRNVNNFIYLLSLLFFLIAMITNPNKSNLRKEDFVLAHSLTEQSIKAKKSCQQECGAAGHRNSTDRKQEETNAHAQCTFSILFSPLALVMMPFSVRVGLPTFHNPI